MSHNDADMMARLALTTKAASAGTTGALVGAGVGAAGMGVADYLTSRDPRKALRSALMGGLFGAGSGWGIGHVAGRGGGDLGAGLDRITTDMSDQNKAIITVPDKNGNPVPLSRSMWETGAYVPDVAREAKQQLIFPNAAWGGMELMRQGPKGMKTVGKIGQYGLAGLEWAHAAPALKRWIFGGRQ